MEDNGKRWQAMGSNGKQAMIGSFELRICALTNWLRSTHYSAALLPKRELCLCSFKYAAIGIALICTASEQVLKHLKYHTDSPDLDCNAERVN